MLHNRKYTDTIISGMEKAATHMQPTVELTKKRPLPETTLEITPYIECLLDIDIEEECTLSADEAIWLTYQKQEACDRATD